MYYIANPGQSREDRLYEIAYLKRLIFEHHLTHPQVPVQLTNYIELRSHSNIGGAMDYLKELLEIEAAWQEAKKNSQLG